jgi:hypothetical protein
MLGTLKFSSASYESTLEAASETSWHFELGLALLLSGRFDGAKTSYSTALVETTACDIRVALADLEFWTERQADSIISAKAKETINAIRRDLQTSAQA